MRLTPGVRLGPYQIVSAIGAGGMGEVYKARDTRLDRTVAIKVLPEDVAATAPLRARFEREARAIAALSHPNICTVHDVGREGETDYLVMEYLEGETLADRLTRAGGPLPIAQVLPIGIAIAEALDKAHRAGIGHRDLKPANVMLTKTGPKLLDFGLAKALMEMSAKSDAPDGHTTKALTDAHTIVGTIYYMAPEQLEGREADARSDIWALGAVLYEMATGTRPFDGESSASVIGAILKDTVPAVSARQPLAPAAFDHAVDRCLQKDPDERWQDAGDVKRQLQWIATARSGTETPQVPTASRRTRRGWLIAAASLAAGVAFGGGAVLLRPQPAPETAPRTVLSFVPPDHLQSGGSFALSPDGKHFAFVGLSADGPASLWIRSLESSTAQPLPGTEDASYPFWSPQGDAIGFFAAGKLKTVTLSGAAPRTLATVANGRGGAWSLDGTILYAPQNSAIYKVSDKGGPSTMVTAIDKEHRQVGHRWATFVDARHFVYTVQGPPDATGIYLTSLDSTSSTKLTGAYSNTIFVDGRLLFVLDGMLVGQTLDVARGQLAGTAAEIVGPMAYATGLGYAPFSVSLTGILAYTAGSGFTGPSELVWLDREGKRIGTLGAETGLSKNISYDERLSPDGKMLAIALFRASTSDIWLIELARGAPQPFTFNDANDQFPLFSPDGANLVFASNRSGVYNIFRKPVGGSSEETPLLKSTTDQIPTDWSSHGPTLLFTTRDSKMQWDIWKMPTSGGGEPGPVLATQFNEYRARLSPDGKWMAYTSDASGQPEVWILDFPAATRRRQISTQGGSEPAWRADGRELFYLAANQTLTAVPMSLTPDLTPGRPAKLSDTVIDTALGSFNTRHYTPTADGQRFLVNISVTNRIPPTVVLNWNSGLKPPAAR